LIHAFFRWLENYSTRHEHTISLLEAVSTTAAVIIALLSAASAKRASLPRLRAALSVIQVIYGDGRPLDETPSYIALHLTNVGNVPVRVGANCFGWRLRLKQSIWMPMILDASGDDHIPRRQYPIVLMPRTSETIYLTTLRALREAMPRILDTGRFGRKITAKFLLRGVVYADDGSQFLARMNGSFSNELKALVNTSSSGPAV
jgi:hypothetical protein